LEAEADVLHAEVIWCRKSSSPGEEQIFAERVRIGEGGRVNAAATVEGPPDMVARVGKKTSAGHKEEEGGGTMNGMCLPSLRRGGPT